MTQKIRFYMQLGLNNMSEKDMEDFKLEILSLPFKQSEVVLFDLLNEYDDIIINQVFTDSRFEELYDYILNKNLPKEWV